MLGVPFGPAWQFSVDNFTGTPTAAAPGTNFTYGANNVDGATVQVLAALAQDVQYVVIAATGCQAGNEDNSALGDLLSDPAGGTAWGSFIDNLVSGCAPTVAHSGSCFSHVYHFPVFIKAGTSLAWRARKAGATAQANGQFGIWCFGQPMRQELWWCGSKVESLGINEASSKGTAHTPGNSGAFSAFASIGAVSQRAGAIQFGVNASDSATLGVAYHWQLGLGGEQIPGTPTFWHGGSTAEVAIRAWSMPLFCDIPAGGDVQVRATCSGVAEAWNVAAYAVS